MDRYQPPKSKNWEGRSDEPEGQRIHQAIKLIDLSREITLLSSGSYAFIGFACDRGVIRNQGRPGANQGPVALRKALAKLPLAHSKQHIFDAGDIVCNDKDLEGAQNQLAEAVAKLLKFDATPIILGGGHETAWGHYQGIKKAGKHKNVKSVNFDAHYDLRPLLDGKYGSSGTSFLQIAMDRRKEGLPFDYTCVGIQTAGNTLALCNVAKELQVKNITADYFFHTTPAEQLTHFKEAIEGYEKIHLSICMDVFASAYAPGVSAPQPLGLTPWQVIPLLQELVKQNKILSVEIAEVSPPLDFEDHTSRLAASLIYYIISSN